MISPFYFHVDMSQTGGYVTSHFYIMLICPKQVGNKPIKLHVDMSKTGGRVTSQVFIMLICLKQVDE